jgi:hypothetical protein
MRNVGRESREGFPPLLAAAIDCLLNWSETGALSAPLDQTYIMHAFFVAGSLLQP